MLIVRGSEHAYRDNTERVRWENQISNVAVRHRIWARRTHPIEQAVNLNGIRWSEHVFSMAPDRLCR